MNKALFLLLIPIMMIGCKSKTISTDTTQESTSNSINWLADNGLENAYMQAAKNDKLVFVDLSAVWCGWCKKMKKEVYTQASVAQSINAKYVALALDGEKEEGPSLVSKYGINGFPAHLILNAKGELIKKNIGYLKPEQLQAFLK